MTTLSTSLSALLPTTKTPSIVATVPSYSSPPTLLYEMNGVPADWSSIIDPLTTVDSTNTTTISQIHLDSITKEVVKSAVSPYLLTTASSAKFDYLKIVVDNKLSEMKNYMLQKGYTINPDTTATGPSLDLKYRSWISDYDFDTTRGTLSFNVNTANYSIQTDYRPYCYEMANGDYYSCETSIHKQEIQRRLKNNLVIISKTRAIKSIDTDQEIVAKNTLREIVSESEFRKYLKYGFILVKGESGATYQIFRNNAHTKVWKGGQLIEEICVRLQGDVPKTDNVIAFKTMIEADEQSFKKLGNVYQMRKAA